MSLGPAVGMMITSLIPVLLQPATSVGIRMEMWVLGATPWTRVRGGSCVMSQPVTVSIVIPNPKAVIINLEKASFILYSLKLKRVLFLQL